MTVKEYNTVYLPKIEKAESFIYCINHALDKSDDNAKMQMRVIGWDDETAKTINEALELLHKKYQSEIKDAVKIRPVIYGFDFNTQWDFLNNQYPYCIQDAYGIVYSSVERAYLASRTTDAEKRLRIAKANTNKLAKALSDAYADISNWEGTRYWSMYTKLLKKFKNPTLRQKLLDTGNAKLINTVKNCDNYWGQCMCKYCRQSQINGTNRLGELLMRIRDEAREGKIDWSKVTNVE